MSKPEVLWQSSPQYVVEIEAYETFVFASVWEPYGYYETFEKAKEIAEEISETNSSVRIATYGKD